MSLKAFRLATKEHVETAFNGKGSQAGGGRWNPKGIPVVYCSGSLALAQLEVIANQTFEKLRELEFVYFEVGIPSELVKSFEDDVWTPGIMMEYRVGGRTLVRKSVHETVIAQREREQHEPGFWMPPFSISQEVGMRWATEELSAVLRVPSKESPEENNYVLNPHHPEFERIKIGPPSPFQFDPRLTDTYQAKGWFERKVERFIELLRSHLQG